jgi:4-carboxymuconolactone decarboxylase
MTPEQRAVHDEVVSGPRGRLIGPLRAVIHSPDLAARWSRIGEFLRYSTCLPKKLSELAIIVTGRHWNSQLEFYVHAEAAREAGLDEAIIEAIRCGEAPLFAAHDEADVYEFARLIQQVGQVPDTAYRAIERRWGPQGVVELTALVGYYTMVSMTLNAHEIPMPGEAAPLLDIRVGQGLTLLPAARLAKELVA